jgi:hypothetical protein
MILTCLILVEASCADASAPPGASPGNTPVSEHTALDPSPAPTFPTTAVGFAVCASGDGWARPDDERQREYLLSLASRNAARRGATIAGETVGRDRGSGQITEAWEYRILWPLNLDTVLGETAFPHSGLWSASPDLSACDRDRVLTLIIDHHVQRVRQIA